MYARVSVIIPCYNMGEYLNDAVASVLSFSSQERIETIIVNDGSNDPKTIEVLNELNGTEDVQIIHQENHGLSHARNTAIKLAKGEFIVPLDADNKIFEVYIIEALKIFDQEKEVGIVFGNLERFGKENQKIRLEGFDISKMLVKNYIDACVVMRKAAWEEVNGYDEKMKLGYEDWDFHIRCFFNGWQFRHIDKQCFAYRVRENSMLKDSNKKRDQILC